MEDVAAAGFQPRSGVTVRPDSAQYMQPYIPRFHWLFLRLPEFWLTPFAGRAKAAAGTPKSGLVNPSRSQGFGSSSEGGELIKL